jgi:exopolysaccharide production protein ExoQ
MPLLKYLPETAIFLLFFLMSTEGIGGAAFVVIEFGLVGLLVATHPKTFLDTVLRWWPLMLTPMLAVASTLWSPVPDISLRYSAQLLFTVFTGVFSARLMPPRRWVCTFMLSLLMFCVISILSRREGQSDVGMVLIGLAGSKNSMSAFGQMLLIASIAVMLMGVDRPLRLLAMAAAPVGAFIVVITNSATAAIFALGGAAMIAILWFARRMTPGGRLATVVMCALVLAPLIFLAPEISAIRDHILYDTLNKDPTLTGRTLLWARADDLIAHKPFLGYGYQSIWMGDSFDTIGLKRLTGITDGRLFHFHNTFRQIAVDTGLAGMAIFAVTLIVTLLKFIAQTLLRPTGATSYFFVTFLLSCMQAFTDTVMQPFLMGTVILYACCTYAQWRPETAWAREFQPVFPRRALVGAGRPA